MTNHEKTSKRMASIAGKILADKDQLDIVRQVAASALVQSSGNDNIKNRETSKRVATLSARLLADENQLNLIRQIAASVLTQTSNRD